MFKVEGTLTVNDGDITIRTYRLVNGSRVYTSITTIDFSEDGDTKTLGELYEKQESV